MIGEMVRARRAELKMASTDLARAAGVSQPAISCIESGQHIPSAETLYKIAQALGVHVGYFFGEPDFKRWQDVILYCERQNLSPDYVLGVLKGVELAEKKENPL